VTVVNVGSRSNIHRNSTASYDWAAGKDSSWNKRFREERLAGLFSRRAGQEASTLTAALEARILQWILKRTPPDDSVEDAQVGNAA
jgi:hypothetical protein